MYMSMYIVCWAESISEMISSSAPGEEITETEYAGRNRNERTKKRIKPAKTPAKKSLFI